MRRIIIALGLAAATLTATSATAQDTNELTCQDLVMAITAVPDAVPLTFTVPLDDFVKQCTSTSNAAISLTSPTSSVTVNPEPNSSQTIEFSVQDDSGHTATANLIVTRD